MEEYKHIPKFCSRSKNILLLNLVCCAIINCTTMGYDSMMMSGLIATEQFAGYFKLDPVTIGLLNASIWMGEIVSCSLMSYFSDNFGRKNAIYISTMIVFAGIILQTAAQNIAMFVVARIVLGFGIGNACGACPLLVAEIAPDNQRGFLVGIYFTMFNAGAIIASAVVYGCVNIKGTWAWRLPAIIQVIPSVLTIILLPMIPESPRWMLVQGQEEYASEVFQIVNQVSKEEAEIMIFKIKEEISCEDKDMKSKWLELFSMTKPMIRRLVIIISLAWLLEMGGSSVGSYYLTILLKQAGIVGSTKLLQINLISSCWNLVASICGAYFFDRIGRKNQALIALTGMIICFFILGGFIKKYGESTDNHSAQYATIFWMFLFNGFYNFCFTPLNQLYPTEIFPTRLRAVGASFFRFWNCGFGLLGAFVLSIAMNSVGWKFYIINAGYDVLFLGVIWFIWVETKGSSLERITGEFGDLADQKVIQVSESVDLVNISVLTDLKVDSS